MRERTAIISIAHKQPYHFNREDIINIHHKVVGHSPIDIPYVTILAGQKAFQYIENSMLSEILQLHRENKYPTHIEYAKKDGANAWVYNHTTYFLMRVDNMDDMAVVTIPMQLI